MGKHQNKICKTLAILIKLPGKIQNLCNRTSPQTSCLFKLYLMYAVLKCYVILHNKNMKQKYLPRYSGYYGHIKFVYILQL